MLLTIAIDNNLSTDYLFRENVLLINGNLPEEVISIIINHYVKLVKRK